MIRRVRLLFPVLWVALLLAGCSASTETVRLPDGPEAERLAWAKSHAPRVDREFRAVWVATVANIDWPSRPGLPSNRQQEELLDILDRVVQLGMNAVILQIRPTADALYDSPLEPWSYYLSGANGQAPEPAWDPLAFAVDEAHRRGLDLHVWLNPYRAWHPTAPDSLAADHVVNRFPDAVHRYGTQRWMDPGSPDIADHSFAVIMDVVDRYDIDGVHMDDYFYPYAVNDAQGRRVDFPDSLTWAAHGEGLDRDDWRRRNVDRFIERVYFGIKERKPHVLFGLSPFGIWRPGYPEGVTGFDQYAGLYADARKWLREGWVDYFTPQLYWNLESAGQPYEPLLTWWLGENRTNRHIWPGNAIYRADEGEDRAWPVQEILDQVTVTRRLPGATGNVFFSMQALRPDDRDMADSLVTHLYPEAALVPATTWLGAAVPAAPTIEKRVLAGRLHLRMTPGDAEPVRNWVVQLLGPGGWSTRILPGPTRILAADDLEGYAALVLRAVGRLGLESEPVVVSLP
jgi:uncharacterized lipoprotein YddW (UPF0748 family)